MGRPLGQVDRSLAALAFGAHAGAVQRDRALFDTKTGEYEQQVHVPLSGTASSTWGSIDVPVQWEQPFLYAPLQRRVPFPTPHFGRGFELIAGQGELIVFDAQVVGWTITEQQWYVGATVRFSVCAPNATGAVPYSAIAHLSFEGYSSMSETDEFA